MEALHFISGTPLGIIIAVCVTGYTAYIAYKKQRNEQEDRLIKILESTVQKLEKQSEEQSQTISDLNGRVLELEKTNKQYLEILQGRDSATAEFMKKATESMDKVDRMHNGLIDLVDMLSGHLKVIGCPHGFTDEDGKVVE